MSAQPGTAYRDDDAGVPLPPARTSRATPAGAPDDGALLPPFAGSRRVPVLAAVTTPPVVAAKPELPSAPDAERAHAAAVADRLERLAADLRHLGFRALLEPRSNRETIDVLIAALLAGYLARR